jgi:hypothetical protein
MPSVASARFSVCRGTLRSRRFRVRWRPRLRLATKARVLAFVGGWASAQSRAVVPVTPMVLSGGNLGFRVEGYRGAVAVGTLVVQVDGQWIETESSGGVLRLTAR